MISVIIPVYNAEDFIEKSYSNIINQNLGDYEIIYVDNNSKDGSVKKIKNLESRNSRVNLLYQPRQGAAAARNLGIKNAKGKFIYIYDVDDEIYPDAILKLKEVLENNLDVDAVFGKMVKSNKSIEQTEKPKDETDEVIFKETPYWGLKWFRDLSAVMGPPAFLYRSRVFSEIGYYNEDISVNEDTAFDIKLGMLKNVAFLDRYVYLYFKHQESIIQTTKQVMPRAFMMWPRLVKEHLPFYLENDVPKIFERTLYAQIYQAMGRQICYTKSLKERRALKTELLNDVSDLNISTKIKYALNFLVIFPYQKFRKLYGYYIVRNVLSKYKQSKY